MESIIILVTFVSIMITTKVTIGVLKTILQIVIAMVLIKSVSLMISMSVSFLRRQNSYYGTAKSMEKIGRKTTKDSLGSVSISPSTTVVMQVYFKPQLPSRSAIHAIH